MKGPQHDQEISFPYNGRRADPDPANRRPEVRDAEGKQVSPAHVGVRYFAPGEEVEMSEESAARIYAAHGSFEDHEAGQAARHEQARAAELGITLVGRSGNVWLNAK